MGIIPIDEAAIAKKTLPSRGAFDVLRDLFSGASIIPIDVEAIAEKPLPYITSVEVDVLRDLFSGGGMAQLDFKMQRLYDAVAREQKDRYGHPVCDYYPKANTTVEDTQGLLKWVQGEIQASDEYNYTHGDFNRIDQLEAAKKKWAAAFEYYKQVAGWMRAAGEPQREAGSSEVEAVAVEAARAEAAFSPTKEQKAILEQAIKAGYFERAIKAGYMSKTETGYKWHKSNSLLAYFCGHIWCRDRLGTSAFANGKSQVELCRQEFFPESYMLTLFGVRNLGQSRQQLTHPRGIDELEAAIFA